MVQVLIGRVFGTVFVLRMLRLCAINLVKVCDPTVLTLNNNKRFFCIINNEPAATVGKWFHSAGRKWMFGVTKCYKNTNYWHNYVAVVQYRGFD